MATIDLGIVKEISLSDIITKERARKDMGDIRGLTTSIQKIGLIHPLVVQSETGEAPYLLLAGGRRLEALRNLRAETVTVRIYDHEMTERQIRTVEYFENYQRKAFEGPEETFLIQKMHATLQEISPSHTMADTARALGKTKGSISQDLKLANAMEKYPELGLQNAPNKTVARSILKRMTQAARAQVQLDRYEENKKDFQLTDDLIIQALFEAYVVGDFFEECQKLTENSYQLIEVDPPWSIGEEKYFDGVGNSSYQHLGSPGYLEFCETLAHECFRLASEDAWIIWWFGQEWHNEIYDILMRAGFQGNPTPAIWLKEGVTPYSRAPYTNLSSDYESFLYVRKGDAKLTKAGVSNVFPFPPIHHSQRIHPTERPVRLMTDIFNIFSFQGARVLIPFAGSGNSIRSCFATNRYPKGFDLQMEFKNAYSIRILQDRGLDKRHEEKEDAAK
jgi:ParB-like chromosome segregation protein Spo0J